MGWPQQPLQEEYQISVKNWIFVDPFYKKEPVMSVPLNFVVNTVLYYYCVYYEI